jgi:hypothetical protein
MVEGAAEAQPVQFAHRLGSDHEARIEMASVLFMT